MRAGDVASRRVALEGTGAIEPLDFSPDGSKLLLGRGHLRHSAKRFLLDLATGQADRAQPAPGGGRLRGRRVHRRRPRGPGAVRPGQRRPAAGQHRPRRRPRRSGRRRRPAGASRTSTSPTTAACSPTRSTRKAAPRSWCATSLTRRALPQPALPVGVLTGLKFSPDGKRLAIGLNASTSPADVWSWDLDRAPAGALDRERGRRAGPADAWSSPSLVRFQSFDGKQIPAWVYKPPRQGALPGACR